MWKKIRKEKRGHQAEGGKLSHYEVGDGLGRGGVRSKDFGTWGVVWRCRIEW